MKPAELSALNSEAIKSSRDGSPRLTAEMNEMIRAVNAQ